MAKATSPASGRRYGVARVCRVWAVPRSSFYAARTPGTGSTAKPVRRGPRPSVSDDALLAAIKNDLERSPWTGEGTARSGPGCARSTASGWRASACCA